MLRTTKKEMGFYNNFNQMIDIVNKAAKTFYEIMEAGADLENRVKEISDYEHQCDDIVHSSFAEINRAFVTPIDREDIIIITKAIDDIMDEIEETAARFVMYNIHKIRPEMLAFSKLILSSAEHLKNLLALLPKKNFENMRSLVEKVNELENEGDTLYRNEIKKLFINNVEATDIIRLSGIYDSFEDSLDACEKLASVIEGIVMKNA